MKLLPVFACALAACAAGPALANDTSAVLGTGGLDFVTNEHVEMQSEELFISKDEVRVIYKFHNDSDADQNVLVAFPMPDIVPNWWSPVAFPEGPADNPFQFQTTFEGKPVETTLHEYAYAYGVDRSDYLKGLGLPLLSFGQAAADATDALDDTTTAELVHLGLVVKDEFDQGQWLGNPLLADLDLAGDLYLGSSFSGRQDGDGRASLQAQRRRHGGVSFMGEPYEDYDPAAEYEANTASMTASRMLFARP